MARLLVSFNSHYTALPFKAKQWHALSPHGRVCVCIYCVYSQVGGADGCAAHLDGFQHHLLPSHRLWKVVLPMHKHNSASAEQQRTQPRDASGPRGPQRRWEDAPHRSPAGTPLGHLWGTPCAQAKRFKEEKKETKLTELNLVWGFGWVFFSSLSWLFKELAHLCFRAGSWARRRERSRRCSSLGNASFSSNRHLAKENNYPKVLIALTPHRCIYTFIRFFWPKMVGKVSSQRRRRA